MTHESMFGSQESQKYIVSEYNKLVHSAVGIEDIQTFYTQALSKLQSIIDKAVATYKNKNHRLDLVGKELEDAALQDLGIKDVSFILDSISHKIEDLRDLKRFIQSETEISDDILVPPSPDGRYLINGDKGEKFEEKKLIPRLLTFLYILRNDLELEVDVNEQKDQQDVKIVQGSITDHMMRKQPYFRVTVDSLNRVVYICDEEGNASFIFNTQELQETGIDVENLDKQDKSNFKDIISRSPKIGKRIIQTQNWRSDIIEVLTNDFVAIENNTEKKEKPKEKIKQKSDFNLETINAPNRKDGWRNASFLRKEMGNDYFHIKLFSDTFKSEHPEWFEIQKEFGKISEHYHPDLVAKIIRHFEFQERKEGWLNVAGMKGLGIAHPNSIRKFAESYRKFHPEWFEIQRAHVLETEHYHPDLVKEITKHFTSVENKEDGWESSRGLSGLVVAAKGTVKEFAEGFRKENPGWFRIMKNRGRSAEHYHPDLVTKIFEHFGKRISK